AAEVRPDPVARDHIPVGLGGDQDPVAGVARDHVAGGEGPADRVVAGPVVDVNAVPLVRHSCLTVEVSPDAVAQQGQAAAVLAGDLDAILPVAGVHVARLGRRAADRVAGGVLDENPVPGVGHGLLDQRVGADVVALDQVAGADGAVDLDTAPAVSRD